jgi:hypothetical protein
LSEEKKEEIESPGSFLKNETWMFEQGENGFIFWDKVARAKLEVAPKAHDYVPMIDCPWKLASELEDYGDEEKLWHEIKTFLIDHVFLPDERLYDVLIAWVKATWVAEQWTVIPYLLIKGPMSSGKTRLLEALEAIAYRGIFSSNMSCSALFRTLELYRPTLFLDEVEIYRKEEYSEVSHLLNAGYRRGQKAWRVEHRQDGTMCIKGYDVFGMKAMAGTEELVGTLQSRSIIIDMVKNIQRVNFRVNEKRARALRNRLLLWRFRQLSLNSGQREDGEDSEDADGVYAPLASLGDGRLIELFYCLLKVSNAGSESILDYAKSMKAIRESEEQTTYQYQILEAMLQCKGVVADGKILAKSITEKMNDGVEREKDRFSTKYILRLLSDLGFKKCHMKQGNGILWNEKMLEYRLRQYRIGYDTPLAASSLSSPSSPNGKLMEFHNEDKVLVSPESSPASSQTIIFERCYLCEKPIATEDWVANMFTANKPAHKECWEAQQASMPAKLGGA